MSTLLSLIPKSPSLTSPTAVVLPSSPRNQAAGQGHPLEQEEFSYGDLRAMIMAFRKTLIEQLGVKKGDIVGQAMNNTLEFMVAFIGRSFIAGLLVLDSRAIDHHHRATSAPLNPAYTVGEFQFYLQDTKPALLLIPPLKQAGVLDKPAATALEAAKKENVPVYEMWFEDGSLRTNLVFGQGPSQRQTVASVGDPSPDDVALVLHTSGTTGRPKSVPLTHRNLMRTTNNIIQTYNLSTADRTYLVMPLFHVHGMLCAFLSPLAAGSSITLPRSGKFSASTFWHDFVSTRCTWYTAVPTIHSILLNLAKSGKGDEAGPFRTGYKGQVPQIRFIRSCSSSLAPSTLHALEATFKAPVLEAYAMTEAAHQMTSNVAGKRCAGTVGIPVGTQISIRAIEDGKLLSPGSIGEVCVRGENVFSGYWANEKANAESFWAPTSDEEKRSSDEFRGRKWFRTGDQGFIIAKGEGKGNLKLTGRIKELINRGGEKISPLEVDSALLSIDGVKEAVCFGVEDAKYGEVVWAGIVLDASHQGSKQEEQRIKKEVGNKIAKFKVPERIIFAKAIPKTATGKIQRRFVRDAFVKQAREETGAKL
ncbi:probable fatty acid transporter FAT2 [Serendipita indica DSM 11827]|uniref:Probable fatty acid transporter FAT2 n=1 Tax=Serendipita indica (strain DSM 11827) TaxID=1109443 RepID=G4TQ07_SERID|nr:probable fatty acid transporter FAT2 [Serendipita indica DSM 11827]